MNKKEAIQKMLDGKKVRLPRWARPDYIDYIEYKENGFTDNDSSPFGMNTTDDDGWEIYEEPLKEEAPEYVDIEVEKGEYGLTCSVFNLCDIIGRSIERHDTRYFATWYVIEQVETSIPVMAKNCGVKGTFASHVRFVREDLLGGITDA